MGWQSRTLLPLDIIGLNQNRTRCPELQPGGISSALRTLTATRVYGILESPRESATLRSVMWNKRELYQALLANLGPLPTRLVVSGCTDDFKPNHLYRSLQVARGQASARMHQDQQKETQSGTCRYLTMKYCVPVTYPTHRKME